MTEIKKQAKKTAKKFVIANWKMHGNLHQNQVLLAAYIQKLNQLKDMQVVVCVPYPYLAQAQEMLAGTNIAWGAQNMAKDNNGAFTGEVSAEMLCDFGCEYVILGHSERATAYCESDENIALKFRAAKDHNLTPVLCVGETLIEREAGVMEMVVGNQLDIIIDKYGTAVFEDAIISYEPIWAIGTGLAARPDQAKAMHKFIRGKISALNFDVKILYGGSVRPQNALQLFKVEDIDGGLIGQCSLNAQEFEDICRAAVTSNA